METQKAEELWPTIEEATACGAGTRQHIHKRLGGEIPGKLLYKEKRRGPNGKLRTYIDPRSLLAEEMRRWRDLLLRRAVAPVSAEEPFVPTGPRQRTFFPETERDKEQAGRIPSDLEAMWPSAACRSFSRP